LSVHQGNGINDCWFIAPAASLANAHPDTITNDNFLMDNNDGSYRVTFPGAAALTIRPQIFRNAVPAGKSWGASNGDWLPVMEMTAGQHFSGGGTAAQSFDEMDSIGFAGTGIRLLTDHTTTTNTTYFSWDSTIEERIQTAITNHKLI